MARADDDLRLLVDRTLSRLFASSEFPAMYTRWFGVPDADTRNFFRLSALPE
jgi:putrescine:ornithine antiporter